MSYTVPTVADFKARFVRDFPYGTSPTTVNDSDITNAIADAGTNINAGLFINQAEYSLAYLYLSAHHLVTSLNAAVLGTSGSFNWMTTDKSVGELSETYEIPAFIKNNKLLAYLTTTLLSIVRSLVLVW